MKTPQKITFKEWNKQVDKYLSRDAFLVSEENLYYCAHCDSKLQGLNSYVSEHDSIWSTCAGGGQVQRILILYCPNCEPVPKERGCIHDIF